MGTWGTGPFDNDIAADWAGDFEDASPSARPGLIRDALAAAAHAEGRVDAGDAMGALAAATLVAATQLEGPDHSSSYGPSPAAVEGLVLDAGLRALAVQAVTRVLGADSEWRELWEEAGKVSEARAAIEPVLIALQETPGGGA